MKPLFKNASKDFLKKNPRFLTGLGQKDAACANVVRPQGIVEPYDNQTDVGLQDSQCSEPKPALGGSDAGTEKSPTRPVIRFTSFRCKLLDRDNLFRGSKALLDAVRYTSAIRDDSEKEVDFDVTQIKVAHRKDEKTEIVIELLRKTAVK